MTPGIPLEIVAGRSYLLFTSWLAPEASGRDLRQAVLAFGMRRNVEDTSLAFTGGVVTALSEITLSVALSPDETSPLLGRFAEWGVTASFNDGAIFQVAEGVAMARGSAP